MQAGRGAIISHVRRDDARDRRGIKRGNVGDLIDAFLEPAEPAVLLDDTMDAVANADGATLFRVAAAVTDAGAASAARCLRPTAPRAGAAGRRCDGA